MVCSICTVFVFTRLKASLLPIHDFNGLKRNSLVARAIKVAAHEAGRCKTNLQRIRFPIHFDYGVEAPRRSHYRGF